MLYSHYTIIRKVKRCNDRTKCSEYALIWKSKGKEQHIQFSFVKMYMGLESILESYKLKEVN